MLLKSCWCSEANLYLIYINSAEFVFLSKLLWFGLTFLLSFSFAVFISFLSFLYSNLFLQWFLSFWKLYFFSPPRADTPFPCFKNVHCNLSYFSILFVYFIFSMRYYVFISLLVKSCIYTSYFNWQEESYIQKAFPYMFYIVDETPDGMLTWSLQI